MIDIHNLIQMGVKPSPIVDSPFSPNKCLQLFSYTIIHNIMLILKFPYVIENWSLIRTPLTYYNTYSYMIYG